MKKLGKKFSFLTKIMLVIGLLISNLSSLSVVFADEVTMKVSVADDKLNIKYLGELADEVETVRVDVYENYTYMDMTFEEEVINSYNLTDEELNMLTSSNEDEFLIVNSMLSSILFDGNYNALIKIVDTTDSENEELIDTYNFNVDVLHKSGLEISVTDATTGLELDKLEDGRYVVDYTSPKIKVTARVLAGGLNPTDIFSYDDQEYYAIDLLSLDFVTEKDFNDYLYGDYKLPVEVNLLNSSLEEVKYNDTIDLLYGKYDMNTSIINDALVDDEISLGDFYEFYGDTKDGIFYVLLNKSRNNTMLDLYKVANYLLEGQDNITYVLSNSEYDDVLDSYDEETSTISIEEYLEGILLDDTSMLSLINDGLTITYKAVILGDLNNDNELTNDDLLELINQVIGKTTVDIEKSNLYMDLEELDDVVDTLDVMYLDQVIKNDTWNLELVKEEATFVSRLDVVQEDIVSGDEFTVNYVLSASDYEVNGISGVLNFDKEMLELVSVKSDDEWLGNNNDGKFLYLNTEDLNELQSISVDSRVADNLDEYVLITATFRALKSGTSSISIDDLEYFNQDTYYVLNEIEEISTLVVVNASDDNSLSSLNVAGKDITLLEDTLDYEITVSNDVTTAEINAVVSNVAASITSIVSPEELVEGENTITITVTSESGNEKVYTITVIREKSEETNNTTLVNYVQDDDGSYEENNDNEVVTPDKDDNNNDDDNGDKNIEQEEDNLSRIIIIILILLVIAGLIYLIFKDEDDEETKKANKEVNKLKKEVKEPSKNVSNKTSNSSKNKNNSNKKRER